MICRPPGSRRRAAAAGPAPVYRIKGTIGKARGRSHGDARGRCRGRPGEEGGDRQRPGPAGPHPCREDAADHQAHPLLHARGRRHLFGPGGLSGRQPVEPGCFRLAAAPELEEHHCVDRGAEAAALQPRHGLRPRAARPAARGREDRGLSGRIGQGPVPRARQYADRRLARPLAAAGDRQTLDDVQRDVRKQDGDRHASVVDPVNRMLYEFYR